MVKPTLRSDAYYDLQGIIADSLKRLAIENHIYQCCFNCDKVDLINNECGKWKVKPPIEIITFGCPDWSDKDDIPF